jgi:hypothetical protein
MYMCDANEMMVIEVGMLRKNGYCWGIGAINCRSIVGNGTALVLSLCVKALARWIIGNVIPPS